MKKENLVPKVLCRDCGNPMKQYPYNLLAWGCKKCKLKAELSYMPMPVLKLKGDYENE